MISGESKRNLWRPIRIIVIPAIPRAFGWVGNPSLRKIPDRPE
jgi:hypothetical protein